MIQKVTIRMIRSYS